MKLIFQPLSARVYVNLLVGKFLVFSTQSRDLRSCEIDFLTLQQGIHQRSAADFAVLPRYCNSAGFHQPEIWWLKDAGSMNPPKQGKGTCISKEWNILSVASSPFSGVELFLSQKLQFTLII